MQLEALLLRFELPEFVSELQGLQPLTQLIKTWGKQQQKKCIEGSERLQNSCEAARGLQGLWTRRGCRRARTGGVNTGNSVIPLKWLCHAKGCEDGDVRMLWLMAVLGLAWDSKQGVK